MEEIIKLLLGKPLAFIITIGGIVFLGLSGLTKFFKIEVNTTNSKRLFIAGISLVIIGIPIYYVSENKESSRLDVELLKVEFFKKDSGHTCTAPYTIHVRETYKIVDAKGAKLTKIILDQEEIGQQEIIYQDGDGNFAINYCFRPGIERVFKAMIVSTSGKASNIFQYKVSTTNPNQVQDNAPELSKY